MHIPNFTKICIFEKHPPREVLGKIKNIKKKTNLNYTKIIIFIYNLQIFNYLNIRTLQILPLCYL